MKAIVNNDKIVSAYNKVIKMDDKEFEQCIFEMYKYQPTIFGIFKALEKEVRDPEKMGYLFMLMVTIWLSIRDYNLIKKIIIDEDLFELYSEKNINFIAYLDKEQDKMHENRILDLMIDNYNQKFLFVLLFHDIYHDNDNKYNFELYTKSKIINYLKALIDCIDFVLNGN